MAVRTPFLCNFQHFSVSMNSFYGNKDYKTCGEFQIIRDKIIYVQNYLCTVLFIPIRDGSRYKTNCDFETAIPHFSIITQALVVQRADNFIHWIAIYPLDKSYPLFEQPGPGDYRNPRALIGREWSHIPLYTITKSMHAF